MGIIGTLPGAEFFLGELVTTAGFLEGDPAAVHGGDHRGLASDHPSLGVGRGQVTHGACSNMSPGGDGLIVGRLRRPEWSDACRLAVPPGPGAGDRIILERRAVTGGDGALGRQGASRRTARDALAADERRDGVFVLVLTHDLDPLPASRVDRFQGMTNTSTRSGFNITEKGEFFQKIYV
jgi:hypothetical protein